MTIFDFLVLWTLFTGGFVSVALLMRPAWDRDDAEDDGLGEWR